MRVGGILAVLGMLVLVPAATADITILASYHVADANVATGPLKQSDHNEGLAPVQARAIVGGTPGLALALAGADPLNVRSFSEVLLAPGNVGFAVGSAANVLIELDSDNCWRLDILTISFVNSSTSGSAGVIAQAHVIDTSDGIVYSYLLSNDGPLGSVVIGPGTYHVLLAVTSFAVVPGPSVGIEVAASAANMITNITPLDCLPPDIEIVVPHDGDALQDSVILTADANDSSGVAELYFCIREPNDGNGVPIGYEDLPGALSGVPDRWEYPFDTTLLPDGYYVIMAKAADTLGNEGWSDIVSFSIRNWAVLELLPASRRNNPGRTMPIKFSLRVAESVDPAMPFVYNEELEIAIYDATDPNTILQASRFGDSSTDYRIDSVGEKYITNFQTDRNEKATYVVEVWRIATDPPILLGSFSFQTARAK
ncbi:MAG: hypothetical protein ACYTEQ_03970 [Planctomycetota bacterium]